MCGEKRVRNSRLAYYNSLDATNKEQKDPVIPQSSEFIIRLIC